jgi:hypothetical protein
MWHRQDESSAFGIEIASFSLAGSHRVSECSLPRRIEVDRTDPLEGVLVPPGTFRVYLYDDHTKPSNAEETRQASGTVQVGESDDAPKIDFAPGKKKETLEAALGNGVKFPVTLTLLLHLPGMVPDAKPELFNFEFTQFTDERGPGTCHPAANMPNMRC